MRRKLSDNVKKVRDRIVAACVRANRPVDSVTLVAVTKTIEVDIIRQGLDLGLTELGESRVQELCKRAGMIDEYRSRRLLVGGRNDVPPNPNWHMIGHLQRNKVKVVLPWTRTVHSVDSLRLADEISRAGTALNRTTDILIQVNVSEEKTKYGIAVGATSYLIQDIRQLPNIRVVGLMTMAPLLEDPEQARVCFTRLRELFEEINLEKVVGPEFTHLSMGMSHDFEVAIEEGATMVRVGTALYEGLTVPVPEEEASS